MRIEPKRLATGGGEEVDEELGGEELGEGWTRSILFRPTAGTRFAVEYPYGWCWIGGSKPPRSSLVYRCPSPNAFLLLHTRCTGRTYALWQRCARVAPVTLWPHDVSQCATDQKTSSNTPRDRIREIQRKREGERHACDDAWRNFRIWFLVAEMFAVEQFPFDALRFEWEVDADWFCEFLIFMMCTWW